MAAPSTFLTSYRTTLRSTFVHQSPRRLVGPVAARRPFSYSVPCRKTGAQEDMGPGKDHTLDKAKKGDTHNVQVDASQKGRADRQSDTGGNATEQRDSAKSREKAKNDHPEAPQPVIGMEDERGGKGH